MIELKVNYESWMNTHMNELHLSCENGVSNIEWLDPNLIIILEGL
jgi:hypothetical protein